MNPIQHYCVIATFFSSSHRIEIKFICPTSSQQHSFHEENWIFNQTELTVICPFHGWVIQFYHQANTNAPSYTTFEFQILRWFSSRTRKRLIQNHLRTPYFFRSNNTGPWTTHTTLHFSNSGPNLLVKSPRIWN